MLNSYDPITHTIQGYFNVIVQAVLIVWPILGL